jgi:hypothetical protein
MLDQVVVAVRASPDWDALARDYLAGHAIDPERYARPQGILSFPSDIVALIARWNNFSAVDFFTCRSRLKTIARALLDCLRCGTVIVHTELPSLLQRLAGQRFVLCFCDDDDWFTPELFEIVGQLDFEGIDVAVFPLVRFELNSFTLTPRGDQARIAVGPCYPFVLRYHTNNYLLTPRALGRVSTDTFLEHAAASAAANRLGFVDRYFDLIVSATNKSPCSASVLRNVVTNAKAFEHYLDDFVSNLRRLAIPTSLAWMFPPLEETIRLFEVAVGRTAKTAH